MHNFNDLYRSNEKYLLEETLVWDLLNSHAYMRLARTEILYLSYINIVAYYIARSILSKDRAVP